MTDVRTDRSGEWGEPSLSALTGALPHTLASWNTLLEALPAAVYTTDAKGRITFFNQAAVDLSGRTPRLGTDEWCITWKLYRPDGTPLAHEDCPMAVALKEGRAVRGEEVIAERPDGTRVPILPYPTPLRDEAGIVVGAVNMLVDISERKKAEARQTLLLRELAHRVNNTLAIILAMTQQSLRTMTSPEAFAESFAGRLRAFAQAHRLLLVSGWSGADLADLARAQLHGFAYAEDGRVTLDGPAVRLGPTQVTALGIVLHELGTNARKFGALTAKGGSVALSWEMRREAGGDRLHLRWSERGGPRVVPPSQRGLGSRLIERGLPDAVIDWRFEPDGVICLIDLKLAAHAGERPASEGLVHAASAR
jgi:PAS domain S-box-containing protein